MPPRIVLQLRLEKTYSKTSGKYKGGFTSEAQTWIWVRMDLYVICVNTS